MLLNHKVIRKRSSFKITHAKYSNFNAGKTFELLKYDKEKIFSNLSRVYDMESVNIASRGSSFTYHLTNIISLIFETYYGEGLRLVRVKIS